MPEDLRPETIAAITGLNKRGQPTISDVKQQADDMNVIDKTIDTAKRLSGTHALEEQLDRVDKQREKAEQERDKAIEDKHKSEIENVKTELGAKIDHLQESWQGGASKKTITDEIADIKKAATELGLGGSKVSEMRELMALLQSLNPKRNLADEIKEAKTLIETIQPAEKEKPYTVAGMPADIVLQVKKMEADLQIQLEEMKDAREHRQQEFQLALRKFDEDRLARIEEIQSKVAIERERNEMAAGAITTFGRAVGRGFADAGSPLSPGGIASQQPPMPDHVEIAVGAADEFQCPKCQGKIAVGPTSTTATCVGCNSQFPIKRIPGVAEQPMEA